ncbi:YceI family protein [Gracilimonas mengyeensis]|uniref:Lipid/polyisoprenoid-binding YceI-like domain-containing protein n=1 Tax=Gracilimonas mengyeensis TaxID=1302730 RepID=A0A521E9U3_9BACT|nr:YceI family protein [Gracilimonas mengyeensis]SMO80718.1 hypothetical protein SAMN06265219_11150 [Gracilimonas mengyeensis]
MSTVHQKLLALVLLFLPLAAIAQNGQVQLSNESKLSINGKSNVNDFRCYSEHQLQQDSLSYSYHFEGDVIEVDGVSLSLQVDQFDCGRKGINRDFRSALQYKEYPFIHITLNELILENEEDIVPSSARVTIKIAGVEQKYTVPLNAFSSSEERIIVGGSKVLSMHDFGIDPPSPMLGLIKVSDELDIQFDLVIRY